MAIPDFQAIMLPVLKLLADGETHSFRAIVVHMEEFFSLTEEEKMQRVPSGVQRTIYNRSNWAIMHLKKAALIEMYEKRGNFRITAEGKKLLSENPQGITTKMLKKYDSYRNFVNVEHENTAADTPNNEFLDDTSKTPQEIMGILAEELNLQLAKDLLDEIHNNTPSFFERLVVDLILKMGYGGLDGTGEVTKKTSDGGIDGIVKQDELGLDVIYIQAKRWEKNSKIGRGEIQKFAGALGSEGATKGLFITTASFSKGAIECAKDYKNAKIILVDGLMLAKLMTKHDLGVSTSNVLLIKRIDADYFDE
ncbi:MAG: restriction endonuclease [Turicibacter sp.]|nr:restriction endonuclease [Turicibacter sp.]